MKFAVIANPDRLAIYEPLHQLFDWVSKNSGQVFLFNNVAENLDSLPAICIAKNTESECIDNSDVVVAIGGDGTILRTAKLVKDSGKPILGVNSGRMGFMANIPQERFTEALDSLKSGDAHTDKRYLLKATVEGEEPYYALNEFLFSKKGSASMVTLGVAFDGVFVNNYWADGVLISTPSGSTAYNLSSGGPIVMPESQVLVITPINPHTLTTRPLVLPDDRAITVSPVSDEHEMIFSGDGLQFSIPKNVKSIKIERTSFSVSLLQLPDQNYFETLRTKLMWGADVREK